jgi:hypothetical protein
MRYFENPAELWTRIWRRTLILTAISAPPFVLLGRWRMGTGILGGAGLLLGVIFLMKAGLMIMAGRAEDRRRLWLVPAGLMLHMVLVAGVLFLLFKFNVAHPVGLFVGVTLPLVAMVSALVGGKKT